MTVTALVTERQDASAFLEFLADVLGAAKTPVTTALQTALVPSVGAQADETEASRLEASRTAYEEALNRALAAATACSAKTTDALDAAQRAARTTAHAQSPRARASVARRSTTSWFRSTSIDASAVQAGCLRARDALRRLL